MNIYRSELALINVLGNGLLSIEFLWTGYTNQVKCVSKYFLSRICFQNCCLQNVNTLAQPASKVLDICSIQLVILYINVTAKTSQSKT